MRDVTVRITPCFFQESCNTILDSWKRLIPRARYISPRTRRKRDDLYITWERYLANQQQLLQNGPRTGSPGVPRSGKALLTSLLVCGACGRRMYAIYRSKSTAYYGCMRRKNEGSTCCGLEAGAVDDLVAQQVLRALEPATLELSLKAIQDVHKERDRLHRHWKHRLERAVLVQHEWDRPPRSLS